MLRRLAAPVALLIAAAAASAQDGPTIKIEFSDEGEREVWVHKAGDAVGPPSTQSVSGKSTEIEVPSSTRGVKVYVHDKATGNVASRFLSTIMRTRSDTWQVRSDQEKHAFRITFRIEHDGEPVAIAMVKLSGNGYDEDELLTPADDGSVSFYTVPYGDVKVTVEYKSGGVSKSLPEQEFEVAADSAEHPDYVLTIEDDVETVAAPADPADEADEKQPSNIVATILNMAIGIVAIGGISYMIWRYVKANPNQTAAALKKAGVQIPDDQADTAMTTPKPAGPPEQIILDDAAPEPVQIEDARAVHAAPDTVQPEGSPAVPAAPAAKNPRLVRADGSVYAIKEGVQTAGREAGAELSIQGEASVSRYHAQISRTGDSVSVMDIGSTNGTFINGTKVSAEMILSPGDSVQFGSVQYRYEE